jgi:hypothetical protein
MAYMDPNMLDMSNDNKNSSQQPAVSDCSFNAESLG